MSGNGDEMLSSQTGTMTPIQPTCSLKPHVFGILLFTFTTYHKKKIRIGKKK